MRRPQCAERGRVLVVLPVWVGPARVRLPEDETLFEMQDSKFLALRRRHWITRITEYFIDDVKKQIKLGQTKSEAEPPPATKPRLCKLTGGAVNMEGVTRRQLYGIVPE